jgi:hypothetical protein
MVLALLADTKMQTRRIVKPQRHPYGEMLTSDQVAAEFLGETCAIRCPYGVPGDRLWVKETWSAARGWDHEKPVRIPVGAAIRYVADGAMAGDLGDEKLGAVQFGRNRPSIFMRRWMSRITLEITDVRVERLQDISEADALAEGVKPLDSYAHYNISSDDGTCVAVSEDYIHGIPKVGDTWHGRKVAHVQHVPQRMLLSAREQYRALWNSINGAGSWNENPWVWAITFRKLS